MRVSRLGGVAVVLLATACQGSIQMGSGSGAGMPPSSHGNAPPNVAAKPGTPAPAPMPNVAPQPTPNPAPATVASQPQPHQIARLKRITSFRQTPPPVSVNASFHPSPNRLALLRARTPSPCGPKEMAPGVIVHIDCLKYQPLTKAKFIHPMKRLQLFKSGRLKTDLENIGGPQPPKTGNGNVGDATPLPGTVDHRADGTEGPVKDQDAVGSCTGFSLSATVDNAIRRLNKADVISAMHIWSHYGIPNMGTAGDSNYLKPLALTTDWPYDPPLACRMYAGTNQFSCGEYFNPAVQQNSVANDPVVQAKIKDSDNKGKYKITNITRIYTDPPDTDAFAAVLASGKDIWVAFTIDEVAWGSKSVSGGEIPDYPDGNGGGHAVVLSGYRTKNGTRQFLIHNSWTTAWGGPEKGYAWISEKMVKANLHDAYTIAVQDMNAAPPPPPPPPPNPNGSCQAGFTTTPDNTNCQKICKLDADCGNGSNCGQSGSSFVCVLNDPMTDDDCADDELVDDVTMRCALMCPDDSRQHGGKCTTSTGGGLPPHH